MELKMCVRELAWQLELVQQLLNQLQMLSLLIFYDCFCDVTVIVDIFFSEIGSDANWKSYFFESYMLSNLKFISFFFFLMSQNKSKI